MCIIWYFILTFLELDNLLSRTNHETQNLRKYFSGINKGIILHKYEKINQ